MRENNLNCVASKVDNNYGSWDTVPITILDTESQNIILFSLVK